MHFPFFNLSIWNNINKHIYIILGFHIFGGGIAGIKMYGFSVACEGEDKFAVAREGKVEKLCFESKHKKIVNNIIFLHFVSKN
jgi:hypothetical protein